MKPTVGRYVNRVAIANYQIEAINGRQVSFRYYDNPDGGKEKVLTLDAVEFIRRFVQYVLPLGYMRIRHYGWHHNRKRAQLTVARVLLRGGAPGTAELTLRVLGETTYAFISTTLLYPSNYFYIYTFPFF